MTDPTQGEWIRSACPSCGHEASRQTYDIGSGPELSCASCEWCWGAEGQKLKQVTRPVIKQWNSMADDHYRDYPGHPLHDVPLAILSKARKVTEAAADWGSVDPEAADGIADAVVAELRPWLAWSVELPTDAPVPPHDVDDTQVRGPEAFGVSTGNPSGPVSDAGGAEDTVGSESVEGVAPEHTEEGTPLSPDEVNLLRWDVSDYLLDQLEAVMSEVPDELHEWIIEHIEEPVVRLICERDGHRVIDDQCGIPQHRVCAVCAKSMPNSPLTEGPS